jgi:hypothetical protein
MSFRLPMEKWVNRGVPGIFPLRAFETCVFEQRSIAATSSIVRIESWSATSPRGGFVPLFNGSSAGEVFVFITSICLLDAFSQFPDVRNTFFEKSGIGEFRFLAVVVLNRLPCRLPMLVLRTGSIRFYFVSVH